MKIIFIDLSAPHQGGNQITVKSEYKCALSCDLHRHLNILIFRFFWESLVLYSLLVTEQGPLRNPDPHSALLLKCSLYVFGNFFLASFFCSTFTHLNCPLNWGVDYFFLFSTFFSFSIYSSFTSSSSPPIPSPPPSSFALSLYSDRSFCSGLYILMLTLLSVIYSLPSISVWRFPCVSTCFSFHFTLFLLVTSVIVFFCCCC